MMTVGFFVHRTFILSLHVHPPRGRITEQSQLLFITNITVLRRHGHLSTVLIRESTTVGHGRSLL